jgi:S1-C subfamily serine protease
MLRSLNLFGSLIGGLAAIVAMPAAGQSWIPVQAHDRPVVQPLSRPAEPTVIRREKNGTAFFVDDAGHMLTARHAVEDCARIVVLKEGRVVAAHLVALRHRFDQGAEDAGARGGISAQRDGQRQ